MCDIRITVVGAKLTPALQAYVESKLAETLALLSGVSVVTVDLRQKAFSGAGRGMPYQATIRVVAAEKTFSEISVRPGLYQAFDVAFVQK